MDVPDIKYARSGDVAIAYQVVGKGPEDIVFVRGTLADLLAACDQPLSVDHVRGLASSWGGADTAGEVRTSGRVAGLAFEERGEHALKGVPGTWRVYAVGG